MARPVSKALVLALLEDARSELAAVNSPDPQARPDAGHLDAGKQTLFLLKEKASRRGLFSANAEVGLDDGIDQIAKHIRDFQSRRTINLNLALIALNNLHNHVAYEQPDDVVRRL